MFNRWPSHRHSRSNLQSNPPSASDQLLKPSHKKSKSFIADVGFQSWFKDQPTSEGFESGVDVEDANNTTRKMSMPNMSDHLRPRASFTKVVRKVLSRSTSKASTRKPDPPAADAAAAASAMSRHTLTLSRAVSGLDLRSFFSTYDTDQQASSDRPYPDQILRDSSPGGAEARAAAAQANLDKARSRSTNGLGTDRGTSKVLMLDSGRESGISLLPECLDPPVDHESLDLVERLSTPSNKDKRADPFSILPNELTLNILSFLDATSLDNAALVSRAWCRAVDDQQVWKTAFLDRFDGPWPPGSHPIPIGGQGIGRRDKSHKDWRKMYRARELIEENWRLATTEKFFSTQDKCHTAHLFGHTDSVYCVQFDEQKIITGSRDKTIRVWDIQTYQCLRIIGCPEAINGDRHTARTAVRTSLLKGLPQTSNFTESNYIPDPNVWHIPRDYHTASILCLQYEDDIAITGSSDSTLIVWDLHTWQPIRRLRQHRHGVLDLAFDSDKIISCSKDYTICVWDRHTGILLSQLTGHQGPVNAVQLRGNLLVSASGEGTATLWNLNFERSPEIFEGASPSSQVNPTVVRHFSSRDRGLACVEFSDDAKHVLAGGNDQVIFKYDANTGRCVESISGHKNLVRSLFLDGVNGRVISGSYDMSLRVWDWSTGQQICHFPDWATSWILSAKSDYRRIVSTSQDGRVLILDFGHNVKGAEHLSNFYQDS